MRSLPIHLFVLLILVTSCGGPANSSTATPVGTSALPRPVIFVPGVAGSQLLYENQEYWASVSDQVFSVSDDFLDVLALPEDGIPINGSTHGDILRTESIEIQGVAVKEADFYATIIERFEAIDHKENEMLFIFPYDWRIDIATEAKRLKSFIDDVLEKTEADKVDIVAHSMGGLLTLDALQDEELDGKVAKLVTLGTPILGATKALGVIEYKAICFTEEILDSHCITNPATAQQVIRNFPSAYQLLPSRDFQSAVGSPLEIEGIEVSYDEWAGEVREHRNGALLDAASDWQSQLATRPHDPGIEMLRIVGSDRATPVQIERFTIHDCYFFSAGFCPGKFVTKVIPGPGDGTVPRASSSLYAPERSFDEREGVVNHYVDGVNHMALSQNSGVIDVVFAFLRGESEARTASNINAGLITQLIDDDIKSFEGTAVTLIGPAWGVIEGNEAATGSISGAEAAIVYEGIPGSSLWRSSNSQTFVFSDGGRYSANFTVPRPESSVYQYLEQQAAPDEFVSKVILIEVERYWNDLLDDSAIYRIEPEDGLRFTFDITVGGDPDEVRILVDRDGDGQYESEATEVADHDPLTPAVQPPATPEPTITPSPTPAPSPTPFPTATPEPVTRQLLRVGPNSQFRPDLISAWEIAGDGNQIVLQIEEGVRLPGGAELTSKELIEIIESHRRDFIRYEYLGSEAVDDYTIFIALGTVDAEGFLATIGVIEVDVLPG